MPTLEKLRELEKMRGLAILAVVIIHVTASATVYYPLGSIKYLFYNSVNSLVQFAVPLFIFISSLVLSYRFKAGNDFSPAFYFKRLRGVVLPYLLWSLGYAALKSWLNGNLSEFFWLAQRWEELITGSAFYHLYFFLIIIQLYLVFPLVIWLLRKLTLSQTLLLAVVMQATFYYVNKAVIYHLYPHPGNLLGSYLTVLLVGCWVGLNYEAIKEQFKKYLALLCLVNVLLGVLFVIVNIKVRGGMSLNLIAYYLVYHSFVLLTSWNMWQLMMKPFLNKTFWKLGQHSFAIYLIHPFFLAVWHYFWRNDGLINLSITLGLGFVFVLVCSYLFGLFLRRWPGLGRILLSR